jgi:hypothetical protein
MITCANFVFGGIGIPVCRKVVSPSNLEILAYETSPLGMLRLRRREPPSQPGTIVTRVPDEQHVTSAVGRRTNDNVVGVECGQRFSILNAVMSIPMLLESPVFFAA